MSYTVILNIHLISILLSISFFMIRGMWMFTENPLLQSKIAKVAPHIIDTILLGAGISLAVLTQQYPFYESWLTAKIILLVAYILLGTIALKRGKTKEIRIIAFVSAVAVFTFMVSIALDKSPLGFIAQL